MLYNLLTNPSLPTRHRYSLLIPFTLVTPARPIQSRTSSMSSLRQSSTPAWPLYAKPHSTGLPIQQKSAPSASALKISVPCRIPPSTCTGTCPLTAATTSGSASSVARAPLSWRPPWFDTMMPCTPWWTANSASSAVAMPLTQTSIGAQTDLSHGMDSSHESVGLAACVWNVMGPVGGRRRWPSW